MNAAYAYIRLGLAVRGFSSNRLGRTEMTKTALLSALSALAIAGGFASGAFAQTAAPCTAGAFNCRNVAVTVQGNQVSLDPAVLTVTGRQAPAVKIVWYLATPGYRFVDSYDPSSAMPGTPVAAGTRPASFPPSYFMTEDPRFCYMWASNQTYICTNWNGDAFPWGVDYTLRVVPASGGSPLTANGRVVNN